MVIKYILLLTDIYYIIGCYATSIKEVDLSNIVYLLYFQILH